LSERRAEKSRGPCTIGEVDAVGVIGSGFTNKMGTGLLTKSASVIGLGPLGAIKPGTGSGLGTTGAGSTGTMLIGMEAAGMRSLGGDCVAGCHVTV
jgi:hypothetical protein